MAFKGCGPVFFLLLATLFILEAYAADYQTFLAHHYDYPKSSVGKRYCDSMMKARKMTTPKCKEVNSFIHTTKKNIIDVCKNGEPVHGNRLRRSRKQYSVTTCKHIGGSPRPPCRYRENTSPRFIVIACRGGYPVHFEEGRI